MKKIIFLLCFFYSSGLFCQTFEPTQQKFNWRNSPQKYLSADSVYFQQDNFLLGWQWGATKKMLEAEQSNQCHATRLRPANIFKDSIGLIILHQEYTHSVGPETMNARGIQYEPTLLLDPSNPENLVIRTGDTTRPVFGFLHRRGRISTNPSNDNYNRLIIDGDSVTLLKDSVILSEPL